LKVFDASDPSTAKLSHACPISQTLQTPIDAWRQERVKPFCQTCERYRWADEQCDRFVEGADPWVEDDEEISETLAA
jgi:hypothetical protein